MPELPEVECLVRSVRDVAEGAILKKAEFFREDIRFPIPIKQFKKLLEGQTIKAVERRSKFMLWQTQRGCAVFHLGMTGVVLRYDDSVPRLKHTHAIFHLEKKGEKIFYHFVDPRRFGIIDCHTKSDWQDYHFFTDLGPEPLEEKNLTDHLFMTSRHKKVATKVFLMNAKIVVGVGNIYASESLHRAAIHPERPAGTVSHEEWGRIAASIQKVLKEAIKARGTTFRDYRDTKGQRGSFAMRLKVYGRDGEPCTQCETKIALVKLGGRSTFFCPKCQPMPS